MGFIYTKLGLDAILIKWLIKRVVRGLLAAVNTEGGSITVLLTPCLAGMD
jgi:hypothetical protein